MLYDAVRIKIEQDFEAEEILVTQNIQNQSKFDEINLIKNEPEINFELPIEDEKYKIIEEVMCQPKFDPVAMKKFSIVLIDIGIEMKLVKDYYKTVVVDEFSSNVSEFKDEIDENSSVYNGKSKTTESTTKTIKIESEKLITSKIDKNINNFNHQTLKKSSKSSHNNHLSQKEFKCPLCPSSFDKKISLNRHHIIHVSPQFKCLKCNDEFKKKKVFDNHQCLICEFCDKKFDSRSKLSAHVRNLHTDESQLQLFTCDYCNKKFKYRPSIERHVSDHLKVANLVPGYNTQSF